jgi:hypothetical protein
MAIPKDKEELVKAIVDNYKKLTIELSTIPTDLTTNKELEVVGSPFLVQVKSRHIF